MKYQYVIALPFVALIIISICVCILQYAHIKRHVYVERLLKKMLLQKFHAQIIKHIHPKSPQYRQCHRLIGIGYIWFRKSSFWKPDGIIKFTNKTLPDTISTDFQFDTNYTIESFPKHIAQAFPSKKFTVTQDYEHTNSYLVSSIGSDPETKHIVRVHMVHLQDTPDSHRYRLVCTWVS